MRRAGQHSTKDIPKAAASEPTGSRLPRIRLFESVRFRLTAWYTVVLVVILGMLGIVLSTFMSQVLEEELDDRLMEASEQVVEDNRNMLANGIFWSADDQIDASTQLRTLIASGLFVVMANFESGEMLQEGSPPQEFADSIAISDPEGITTLSGEDEEVRLTLRPLFPSDSDPNNPDRQAIGAVVEAQLASSDEDRLKISQITGNESSFTTHTVDSQRIRLHLRPIYSNGLNATSPDEEPIGAIVVGESLDRQDHILSLFNNLLRTAGAGGVLLATWGGWLLAGRALAPVDRITSTANEIARRGDAQESLSTRLDVNSTGDELARLSITFNDMLDRIERAFRAQRRFVADASHELRTPLTAIRGNVDVLDRSVRSGRELPPDMLKEAFGDMRRESDRMARLIDDLLLLARTDVEGLGHMVNPEPVSLEIVAREAFRTAEAVANGQRLHLTIRQPLLIYGDGDRLVQVMIILLDNALRHTPPGGTVDLIIDAVETPDKQTTSARIQVIDSGEGIPEEHIPHLFDRFFRVEGSRSRLAGGSGLGLAIALAIVRGHNGWIDVESEENQGTHITVWLPILESPIGADNQRHAILPHVQEAPQTQA